MPHITPEKITKALAAPLRDHEHCPDIGACWQDREPCPAGAKPAVTLKQVQ